MALSSSSLPTNQSVSSNLRNNTVYGTPLSAIPKASTALLAFSDTLCLRGTFAFGEGVFEGVAGPSADARLHAAVPFSSCPLFLTRSADDISNDEPLEVDTGSHVPSNGLPGPQEVPNETNVTSKSIPLNLSNA